MTLLQNSHLLRFWEKLHLEEVYFVLFCFQREDAYEGGEGESILSRLCTELGTRHEALSHDPET